jgi:glucokinase
MADFSIGVDLGGTNLRVAAIDQSGRLIEKIPLVTQVSRGRDYVMDEMCDAIRSLVCRLQPGGKLLGVGVGVPGMVDLRTGHLRGCPNLPGWSEVPVRAQIERRLGMSVVLENDANAAAVGEMWLGAAHEVRDLAIFTLGTGVGGGLIISGKIHHGMIGMAGEFGHIMIDPDGFACTCGVRGCLEQYASATAIMCMARASRDAELSAAIKGDQSFSAKCLYELATRGNAAASGIFDLVGQSLGRAVAVVVNALNLPMIVIGGGVANGWEAFAPSLFAELRKRSLVYMATETVGPGGSGNATLVTRSRLGSDAGLYGAARLPMVAL